MPSQHKHPPVSFRPTEANRAWLREQADSGRAMGAVINEALDARRAQESSPSAA
jgi:hypothetical protein